MRDYKKLYLVLFRSITEAIELLQKAQQITEEIYISEKPPLKLAEAMQVNDEAE